MHKSQLITFIIPTRARPELLDQCLGSLNSALRSLGQQDLRDFNIEVMVIFNGEPALEFPQYTGLSITGLSISKQNPSEARNIAIRTKASNYYYFIDDDTQLPADFLVKVCQIIRLHPKVSIFGGPDKCAPGVSAFERSLEVSLQSPLTTQKTNRRHSPSEQAEMQKGTERNLILCNLCVKSSVFEELGTYFPADFLRNEENVFLAQLEGRVEIRFFQNLYIYHKRRHALKNVFYAASRSGYFRMKMILAGIGKNQYVFLVPMFFLLYLVMAVLLLLITANPEWLYPFYLYLVLNLITSVIGCVRCKLNLYLPIVMGYQAFIVLSYAIGTIAAGYLEFKRTLAQKFA